MTDRIVRDIAKMQDLSIAAKPSMIAKLASDWIEANVLSGVPTQRKEGSQSVLQKKKRQKTESGYRIYQMATKPRRITGEGENS